MVEADIARVEQEQNDMEAREERAAIQAESVFTEMYDKDMDESAWMSWMSVTFNYTQEEIDYVQAVQADREDARAAAYASEDTQESAREDTGERQEDGAAQEGARGTAESAGKDFQLNAYTESELAAREAAEQARAEAEQAATAKAEKEKQDRQLAQEVKRRSEAAAETFELGQDGMDNLTGQGGLFGEIGSSSAEDAERFERAMRSASNKEKSSDDGIQTTGLRFVPFSKALDIAKSAVDGGVSVSPAQLHTRLDVTMESADRLIQGLRGIGGLFDGANQNPIKSETPADAGAKEAAKPDAEKNTEDAGQELKYNKRGRKAAMSWDDIKDQDSALRVSNAVKSKVLEKPDYQALVDGGMHPYVAHVVKQVYDAISAKPQTRAAPTDEELQQYIAGANRVMDGVLEWANGPDSTAWMAKVGGSAASYLSAMRGSQIDLTRLAGVEDGRKLLDVIYPDGWRNHNNELRLIGGNKALSAMQPGLDEARKASREIDKGWPAKLESWQRQGFKVVQIEQPQLISTTYYEGTSSRHVPYVHINIAYSQNRKELTLLREDADGASSKHDDAVQAIVKRVKDQVGGKFVLFNKHDKMVSAHDSLEAAQEAAREKVKRSESDNPISEKGISVEEAERSGVARREEGEDITSERLMETFGFRGVNFGNWMKGKSNEAERQLHLNHAYDSFMDLADVMGVPPKAMSLNGLLGLAIGAQGNGRFAAHFVPGLNEINITRTAGAGAVAHEWGHALDHHFARLAGLDREAEPYLTEHATKPAVMTRGEPDPDNPRRMKTVSVQRFAEALRPEVLERFKAIVTAMNKRAMTPEEVQERRDSGIKNARTQLDRWLKSIKNDFTAPYLKSSGKAVNEAEFDALAERIRSLNLGDGKVRLGKTDSHVAPVVAELRDLYKKASGSSYAADNLKALQSWIDSLQYYSDANADADSHQPQMVSTTFAAEARKLDEGKGGKKYWSADIEKFARAFDAFVGDRLMERAIRNTYLAGLNNDIQTSPMGEERKDIGAAFKALVDTIETRETDQGVTLYSFAGQQSKTADTHALSTAQDRLNAGEDAETVRQETGWFKGNDGKWRYEISDADARLSMDKQTAFSAIDEIGGITVADLISHPALLAAYPNLADIPVTLKQGRGASIGSVTINGGDAQFEIAIGRDVSEGELLSVLLHEIQHGIQHIEGFASGGSERGMTDDYLKDKARLEDLKQKLQREENRASDEARYASDELKAAAIAWAGTQGEWYQSAPIEEKVSDYILSQDRLYAEWYKEHAQLAYGKGRLEPHQRYRHLAGEVEARNTQARRNLTDDQRRATPPSQTADVADADVIVVFNGKEMQSAPAPANAQPSTNAPTLTEADLLPLMGKAIGSETLAKVLIDSGLVTGVRRGADFQGATFEDGRIILNLDALTADNFAGVFKHEGFHSTVKTLLGEAKYNQLMKQLQSQVGLAKGNTWVDQANAAVPADTKAAHKTEEIAAYAIEQVTNGAKVPGFIKRWVGELLSALRTAIIRFAKTDSKLQAWAMNNLKPEDLARLAVAGLRAKARGAMQQPQMREAVAYSNAPVGKEIVSSIADMNRILTGKPLALLQTSDAPHLGKAKLREWAVGVFRDYGFYANNKTLGKVLMDERSIRDSIGHSLNPFKAVAFKAVPDVIENGAIVHVERKGDMDSIYISGPVVINGTDDIVTVLVRRDINTQRMYLHSVTTKEGLLRSSQSSADTNVSERSGTVISGGISKILQAALNYNGEDDIRYSRAQPPLPGAAQPQPARKPELPADTLARKAQRKIQDKLNRFTVIKEWLADNGVTLSEQADIHKAEERMHSRFANKAQDFREKRVMPLVQKVQKAGFTMEDVAQFLHANHAQARNAQIAKVNPQKPDGGSGMTNAEAKAILKSAPAELKALALEFRAITEDSKQILLKAGVIDQDTVNAWESAYGDTYVPLKGGPDENAAKIGSGKGLSLKHKQKRALGHETRAEGEWIIENILADHERALMAAEKNRVFHNLVKMALETAHLDLITINKPEKRQVLMNRTSYVVRKKGVDVASFQTDREARAFIQHDATVTGSSRGDYTTEKSNDPSVAMMASPIPGPDEATGYINGHLVRVQFNDPLMAEAYNNMGAEAMNAVFRAGRALNGFFSKVYTGYNPEFIFTNILRDFTTGLANVRRPG